MIPGLHWTSIGAAVGDHLWQSTLCASVACLLTLAFKKNSASIRHWIWLAASLKFLLPFSLLIGLGSHLDFGWSAAPRSTPMESSVIAYWSRPLARPASSALQPTHTLQLPAAESAVIPWLISAVWFAGFATVVFHRRGRGRRLQALVGDARPLRQGREAEALRRVQAQSRSRAQIRLASSTSSIEPGVHGVIAPVLLLPAGIADRLSDEQLEAIVSHELSHISRRDNLTAVVQVAVETIFWFHPLVWWIGSRLVDERERACDEAVLQFQNNPQVYAGAILKVCEFYLMSPLTCVPGITGSNLRKRIEAIMRNEGTLKLTFWRKALLVVAGITTVSLPILFGSSQKPPVAASGTTPSVRLAFDVASIKPQAPGMTRTLVGPAPSPEGAGGGVSMDSGGPAVRIFPGGRLLAAKATLFEIIRYAYHSSQMDWRLEPRRISGGPDWIRSSEYNIEAKAEGASRDQMQLMLQSLLTDRFKLRLHWETRELPVYELAAAKGGLKLEQWKEGSCVATSVPAQEIAEIPVPAHRPAGAAGAGSTPAPRWNPKYYCGVYFRGFGSVQNVYAGKASIAELIRVLEFRVGRTIIDKTGFTRTFNALLAFDPNDGPNPDPSADQSVVPLPTALQEQLGLKLESARGPVSVLVIDSAERPAEN